MHSIKATSLACWHTLRLDQLLKPLFFGMKRTTNLSAFLAVSCWVLLFTCGLGLDSLLLVPDLTRGDEVINPNITSGRGETIPDIEQGPE